MYSQNSEEKFIVKYFNGSKGSLLSIGENDGRTFSNSLRLIELGWRAVLLEPSPVAFEKLLALHKGNPRVDCYDWAVTDRDGRGTLHESGAHLKDKSDYALLSTLKQSEKNRWQDVDFKEVSVHCVTYERLLKGCGFSGFDFITIDAEGFDTIILKQIDLTPTKLICIEHNSVPQVKQEIIEYCAKYGMTKVIYENAENILIAR